MTCTWKLVIFDTLTLDGRVGRTEEEEMQHEIWNGDDTGHQPFISILWNSSLDHYHAPSNRKGGVLYHVCIMYFMMSKQTCQSI